MMKLVAVLLLLLSTNFMSSASDRECGKVINEFGSHLGREDILILGEHVVEKLEGVILDSHGMPLAKPHVEVIAEPEVLLLPASPESERRRDKRVVIARYQTEGDGSFCFAVPPARG